jgi:hypothetical protein
VAVRGDKVCNQQSTITSHVMRRARFRVDGYKVVRRWAVQGSFQLSPPPLPSSQSTSANTTRSMSSPLPSPLASPVASAVGKKSPARSKSSRVTKSSATKKSTAAKKSTTVKKPTMKRTASKSSPLEHPSWKDIIKVHLLDASRPSLLIVPQEAITQHREDARTGVSRSAIKKASCAGCGVSSSY